MLFIIVFFNDFFFFGGKGLENSQIISMLDESRQYKTKQNDKSYQTDLENSTMSRTKKKKKKVKKKSQNKQKDYDSNYLSETINSSDYQNKLQEHFKADQLSKKNQEYLLKPERAQKILEAKSKDKNLDLQFLQKELADDILNSRK